ncbi:MAG: ABC transporter ATP-binding protein [Acidimicrobiales bacterium]
MTGLDTHLVARRGDLELDVALAAGPGTVLAVLGPNGAGKSTALDALCGFLALDAGHVRLGEALLEDPAAGVRATPEQRSIGLVPQSLVLFPHLDARDNVAFGLRCRGRDRATARREAAGWLERLGVGDVAGHRPAALSGGQAQRVALARALAWGPDLLLLDEPLAALDASLRPTTRRDLRTWLGAHGGVTVLVTHDPLDALALADHVVVVEQGRAAQAGTLAEVTSRPRSRYVADLIGTNLLQGRADGTTVDLGSTTLVTSEPATGDVFATIEPRAILLAADEPRTSARNNWHVVVRAIDRLGTQVRVDVDGPIELTCEVTPAGLAALDLHPGDPAWISVKATEVSVYPR